MKSNTAEKRNITEKRKKPKKEKLTLEVIHKSFEEDFDKLKRKVEITENNIHSDTRNISTHVSDMIQEERDQKRSLLMMMSVLVLINVGIAVAAVVTIFLLLSQ